MAPTKLTDEVLESILWNKAPIELQKEIKEITVGSVQELLHKYLKLKPLFRRGSIVARRATIPPY